MSPTWGFCMYSMRVIFQVVTDLLVGQELNLGSFVNQSYESMSHDPQKLSLYLLGVCMCNIKRQSSKQFWMTRILPWPLCRLRTQVMTPKSIQVENFKHLIIMILHVHMYIFFSFTYYIHTGLGALLIVFRYWRSFKQFPREFPNDLQHKYFIPSNQLPDIGTVENHHRH